MVAEGTRELQNQKQRRRRAATRSATVGRTGSVVSGGGAEAVTGTGILAICQGEGTQLTADPAANHVQPEGSSSNTKQTVSRPSAALTVGEIPASSAVSSEVKEAVSSGDKSDNDTGKTTAT